MKRIFIPFLFIILITITGCSEETSDGIKMPFSSGVCKGDNYQDVISDLKNAGFTNIETEVLYDLVTGILTKDGEVEKVSVNGDAKYDPDARYPKDVKIVVTYHTFKEKSNEKTQSTTNEVINSKQVENITVKNNEDFANVLLTSDGSVIKDFVSKYKGQTIEFDGNIADISVHSSYNAINGTSKNVEGYYDILIYAGDYDENTAIGPSFRFESASSYSLGFESKSALPEFIKVGTNVHITAKVGIYNENTCIWNLIPVSIKQR